MADCLRCGAMCAVHTLNCEDDVMKGKDSIDCKTFMPSTIEDVRRIQEDRKAIFAAVAVLRELRKQES